NPSKPVDWPTVAAQGRRRIPRTERGVQDGLKITVSAVQLRPWPLEDRDVGERVARCEGHRLLIGYTARPRHGALHIIRCRVARVVPARGRRCVSPIPSVTTFSTACSSGSRGGGETDR